MFLLDTSMHSAKWQQKKKKENILMHINVCSNVTEIYVASQSTTLNSVKTIEIIVKLCIQQNE